MTPQLFQLSQKNTGFPIDPETLLKSGRNYKCLKYNKMDMEELKQMLAIGNHFMTMVSETTQGVNLQKNLESCKIAIKDVDSFIAQYEKGSKDYKAWVDVRKNYHWVMDRILEKMP